MADLPPTARPIPGGHEIGLKVVPGASRSQVMGLLGDRLKVRVAAPPEQGKANAAVCALLDAHFGVSGCRITAGHASAEKTAFIPAT